MIQEIITYSIVALAVIIAFKKTIKKFSKKKNAPANGNLKKEVSNVQHKCTDCAAECILRDTISTTKENAGNLCNRIDITSD